MMRRTVAVAAVAVAALGAACGGSDAREDLRPVPLPEMSGSAPSVQEQVRERHAALVQALDGGAPRERLGAAFGEFGMLLHAAEFLAAAEPAYANAELLLPDDPRWPYYSGHVHRRNGDPIRATEAFTRALELRPDDVASLVWLARMHIDQGRGDRAEPLLVRAGEIAPKAVAVRAALGQVALARRDYAAAAARLEEALALDPRVASIHAPLAAAYRGLGDTGRAEHHARLWSNTETPLADPLIERLAASVESAASYEARGVEAFDAGNWTEAASLFRRGLGLTQAEAPLGRSLRHKLGLALHLGGDVRGAVEQFEQAARLAPPSGRDEPAARAHYSLGIVTAGSGRDAEAIEHLERAVTYHPEYVQAHLALGDLQRRSGGFRASLDAYRAALTVSPRNAAARLGYALALVRLGRWVDARAWLEEAVRLDVEAPELRHALARILAAAPVARARDGERAFVLVQQLFEASKTTDVGETMAMAFAELGEYERAAGIQRGIIEAAERAGLQADVRRMRANLRLYEQGRPSRIPWPDDHVIHHPGPPVLGLAAASPAS